MTPQASSRCVAGGTWLTTQHYGSAICTALAKALNLSKPNSTALRRILSTLSLCIRSVPLSYLAPLLLDSEIFQHIIAALEDDKASGLILAAYLEILSRIALADPNGYISMVQEASTRQNRPFDKQFDECLDAMWRNFDYVGDTRMRKAVAMAAGRLLTTVSGVWECGSSLGQSSGARSNRRGV